MTFTLKGINFGANLALTSAAVDMTMISRSPSQSALILSVSDVRLLSHQYIHVLKVKKSQKLITVLLQVQLLKIWIGASWAEAGF